jgi:hypothetical protein
VLFKKNPEKMKKRGNIYLHPKESKRIKVRREQADIGIEMVGVEGGGADDDIKELYQFFTQ